VTGRLQQSRSFVGAAALASGLAALAFVLLVDGDQVRLERGSGVVMQMALEEAPAKHEATAPAEHAPGHGLEVEHLALGSSEQLRLDHPALIKSLQDAPISSKEFEDSGRYQTLPPQSIGRLTGVSLRAEISAPGEARLASVPRPAVKTEQHRHSASGFLRAHVEGTAGIVRKAAAREQGGGSR
jgi:hypothetical protein